ncbi:MAG: GIY-YIG nuclease family protein [Candidatus Levybacteria bacterium]|nr:GIY-YIG nuclease family protein [Candidatus Levybacteria bacterium]
MSFMTYILQSDKDGSYYIGSTDNLQKRLTAHNKGYSKYTKNKIPWNIVYKEEYETLSGARKREYYLKSLKSKIAILKLIKQGPIV